MTEFMEGWSEDGHGAHVANTDLAKQEEQTLDPEALPKRRTGRAFIARQGVKNSLQQSKPQHSTATQADEEAI